MRVRISKRVFGKKHIGGIICENPGGDTALPPCPRYAHGADPE